MDRRRFRHRAGAPLPAGGGLRPVAGRGAKLPGIVIGKRGGLHENAIVAILERLRFLWRISYSSLKRPLASQSGPTEAPVGKLVPRLRLTVATAVGPSLHRQPPSGGSGTCGIELQTETVTCTYSGAVQPGRLIQVAIPVDVGVFAEGSTLDNEAEVTGGGALPVTASTETTISSTVASFGFLAAPVGLSAPTTDADGLPSTESARRRWILGAPSCSWSTENAPTRPPLAW